MRIKEQVFCIGLRVLDNSFCSFNNVVDSHPNALTVGWKALVRTPSTSAKWRERIPIT